MAKFVIVLMCLVIIQTSLALKCIRCEDDKCEKTNEELCKPVSDNKELACLTHRFKDAKDMEHIEKRCAIRTIGEKYDCIEAGQNKQIQCDTCNNRDLCNSALRISIPVLWATGLAFLVAKMA